MEETVVRAGDLVFAGGLECTAGDLFGRLAAALAEEGASLDDLIELTTFHADVREMDAAFDAGRGALSHPYPAWTPVTMVAAPTGARLVARAIAHTGGGEKTGIAPDTIAWWRRYPWSAGCRKGDLLAVAGQYGTDTDGNVVTPGYHDGQARNALNRLKETCGLAGASFDDVVSVWSFHQDPRGIEPCTDVFEREFFTEASPAWTAAGTPGLYGFGMLCQFGALAGLARGRLAAAAVEVDGDPRAALERVAALPGEIVEVTCFHKDVRHAQPFREVAREVLGDRPLAWTSVGMTGFRAEEHLHAIHALAVTGIDAEGTMP